MRKWRKLRAILKSMNKGATITAACEGANIHRKTLWLWRKEDPRVNKLIIEALDNAIQVVEDALFRRACGYRYEEVTKEREESTSEKRTVKVVVKEVAPDSTACMFFLMNRAPERWADKRALVNNTNIIKNIVNPLGKLADEELDGILTGFTRKPIS
jgi:transposase-like protein